MVVGGVYSELSAHRNASKDTSCPGGCAFKRKHGPHSLFLPVRWSRQRNMLLLQMGPAGKFRRMGWDKPPGRRGH